MTVISKHLAEHYQWGDQCDGWHLVRNPTLSVIEERMPPNTAEVRHYHSKAEQFFYILSGCATFELDGNTCELTSGQGIHVPAKHRHQIQNRHTEPLSFLVTSSPPAQGDRVTSE